MSLLALKKAVDAPASSRTFKAVRTAVSSCSGVSGYANDTGVIDKVCEVFERADIDPLGRGAYSIVVPHEDEDKVVKLTLSVDDGYHEYVSVLPTLRAELCGLLGNAVRLCPLERGHSAAPH